VGHFRFVINPTYIRACTPLAVGSSISFVVRWNCAETGLHGFSELVPVDDVDSVEIHFRIPGESLRKSVRVEALIVISGPAVISNAEIAQITASIPGEILWRHVELDVQLESEVEQMPIEDVAFGNSHSLWEIRLSTHDLSEAASRCLLVRLNSENHRIREMKDSPESETGVVVREFLIQDFYRTMLMEAIFTDGLEDSEEFAPESVGGLLLRVLRATGTNQQRLRHLFSQSRLEFESFVQSIKWGD
jgi:hypothetical protein